MFKKDKEISDLSIKIERLEKELEDLKNDNNDLKTENSFLNDEIKENQKRLNAEEYKNLSSEKEIQRAKNQRELAEMKLKDIENILEEYRQHVKNSSMDDMKMPGYVFNKYIKEDNK